VKAASDERGEEGRAQPESDGGDEVAAVLQARAPGRVRAQRR
jgi:hypothetical protein